jgi:hypothetical protein
MKIISVAFLLISVFVIEENSLMAQEKSDLAQANLPAQVDLAQTNLTPTDNSTESVELRKIKISASKVFQGLATACVCIAKVVGAKTAKEKQESTCVAISSALQIAADACAKHQKPAQEKTEKTSAKIDAKTESSETIEIPESVEISEAEGDSETKSINFEYLRQIQDLNTDQERMDMINKILQNKQETKVLLDEVNNATKLILIEILLGD